MSEVFESIKSGLNQAIKHASGKGRIARIHRPTPVSVKKVNSTIGSSQQDTKDKAVSSIPLHSELSTQDAADILNISTPFLVKLLEEGEIPHSKIRTRRRILAKDILAYKESMDQKRYKTLEKLSEEAQQLKMGYNKAD